jgi:uncharacterized membrane protein YidH (DUF202 family)
MKINILDILAVLIAFGALAKWMLIWSQIRRKAQSPSAALRVVEVGGYLGIAILLGAILLQ